MARGVTLGELVTDLRLKTGQSEKPALGQNKDAPMRQALREAQEFLYEDHDWPFMRVERNLSLAAGQRYYDFPADLPFDNVTSAERRWGDTWLALDYGIDGCQYSEMDSDAVGAYASFTITAGTAGGGNDVASVKAGALELLDAAIDWATSNTATATAVAAAINSAFTVPNYTATSNANQVTITADPQSIASANGLALTVTPAGTVTIGDVVDFAGGQIAQRADPVQRWSVANVGTREQIEVWPVPASGSQRLRLWGKKALSPLLQSSDRADLDSNLIVGFAALSLLDGKNPRRADIQRSVGRLYQKLKGRQQKATPALNFAQGPALGRPRPGPVRVAYVRNP